VFAPGLHRVAEVDPAAGKEQFAARLSVDEHLGVALEHGELERHGTFQPLVRDPHRALVPCRGDVIAVHRLCHGFGQERVLLHRRHTVRLLRRPEAGHLEPAPAASRRGNGDTVRRRGQKLPEAVQADRLLCFRRTAPRALELRVRRETLGRWQVCQRFALLARQQREVVEVDSAGHAEVGGRDLHRHRAGRHTVLLGELEPVRRSLGVRHVRPRTGSLSIRTHELHRNPRVLPRLGTGDNVRGPQLGREPHGGEGVRQRDTEVQFSLPFEPQEPLTAVPHIGKPPLRPRRRTVGRCKALAITIRNQIREGFDRLARENAKEQQERDGKQAVESHVAHGNLVLGCGWSE
jgi:hypothetical protein